MLKFDSSHLRLHRMLEILFTAAVYFILARLSLLLQFQSSGATPVWPPSGFAFAIMLLLGYRVAPGIMFGAFAGNLFVFLSNKTCGLGTAIWLSFVISIGNTSESLVGYYLLNKVIRNVKIKNLFLNVNQIFRFSFVTVLMCLISCTIGTTAVFLAKTITTNQYSIVWLTWWLGDVSGILLITPFILLWTKSFQSPSTIFIGSWKRKTEAVALFLTVLLCSGYIFDNWFFSFSVFEWAFWIIPILMWASVRFNQRETITAIVLCCIVAIRGTINKHGPFATLSFNESLLTVQAFVSIMAITQLALNASVYQRRQTEIRLRGLSSQLEIRVQKRTAELAHAANELTEKNRKLEKMNQELDSFTYIASHDLQEPLRKIQTFANVIIENEKEVLSEKGKDYLGRMQVAAQRMQQLIEDLLSYSHTVDPSQKQFQKTNLNVLLELVKTELREKISETNAIIEASDLPELHVIPFQFHQLLSNMIGNAIKFSKQGVPPFIRIKSAIINGAEITEVNGVAGENYYHVTISDNGIGFQSDFNEKIFGLFQRLHSRKEYPGTGIGLFICKKIIENHRGILTAKGEPDIGATFDIYLPVS